MIGYLADKTLICGRIWSVSWCLSLFLVSVAAGLCGRHIESITNMNIR